MDVSTPPPCGESVIPEGNVTLLDLSGKNIGDSGCAAIAEWLKNNTTPTPPPCGESVVPEGNVPLLDLSGKNIGDSGFATIAEWLKKNKTPTPTQSPAEAAQIAQGRIEEAEWLDNNERELPTPLKVVIVIVALWMVVRVRRLY